MFLLWHLFCNFVSKLSNRYANFLTFRESNSCVWGATCKKGKSRNKSFEHVIRTPFVRSKASPWKNTDLQYTKISIYWIPSISSCINIRLVNINVLLCALYKAMHIGFLSTCFKCFPNILNVLKTSFSNINIIRLRRAQHRVSPILTYTCSSIGTKLWLVLYLVTATFPF